MHFSSYTLSKCMYAWVACFRLFFHIFVHFLFSSLFASFIRMHWVSLKTCIAFYAACVDCTFFFQSIKCLCKALIPGSYARLLAYVCVYAKPVKGNIVYYTYHLYMLHMRSLALVTLSSYVVSSIGYDGMKLRIELVSWEETKKRDADRRWRK